MKKFARIIAILLLAGLLLGIILPHVIVQAADADANLWVDPVNGKDTNNGTTEAKALKTIQAAKTKAATLSASGDVVVILKGGVYDATDPIVFGSSDSGKNGNTITYRAAEGEEVLISGGEKLTDWTLYDAENNIYVADIPTAAKLTRQFYVDGEPQPLAALEKSPIDWEEVSNGFSVPEKYNFKDLWYPQHVEMNTLYLWYHRVEHFTGINSDGTEIYEDTDRMPTWVSNDYLFIDRAGEWYIDRYDLKIYYKADGTMDGKEAYLPVTEQVIQMDYASNITFEGITFSHTSYTHTSENRYLDQQANGHLYDSAWHQVPAGIELTGCTGITFDGCDIRNMGTAGIRIKSDETQMSDGNSILNCRIYDISYSGIILAEIFAHDGYESYQLVKNTTIQNNLITRIGIDMFDSPGITATYTSGTVIDHNEISYCPYSGISIGWGWSDEEENNNTAFMNEVGNNQITNNYIHDVCKTNYDGGAFYSLGMSKGSVVSGNYIYNSGNGASRGEISLYLDEGSAYMEVCNNVVGGQSSYWSQMYYSNIHDNNWHDNYYDASIPSRNSSSTNTLVNNVAVENGDFSQYPAAMEIIENAGLLDDSLKDGIWEGFIHQHDIVQSAWPGADDRYIEPTWGWENVWVDGQVGSTVYDSINGEVSLVVEGNVDITALALNFTLLDGWTCDKASGAVQDFTNPVTYTLSSGSDTVRWTVAVNQQVESDTEIEGTEVDLSDAFTSSSDWTSAPSSVSGGVMTHSGYSAYIGEIFAQDSIFEFDLSIPVAATSEWAAFVIKAQKPGTMCVYGGTEYYVGFNADDVEVQKFVNGQRTVIFGQVDGFTPTYGVLPNNFFTPGSFHSIRVGAINVSDGVRFFMFVDGNLVFDITDFSNTITDDGYFGVYGMTKSISLRAFTDIQNTPDTTELDKALATADGIKATDYTSESYQNLQDALEQADEILSAYGGVTQTMADEACAVITAALSNLEMADSEQDPIQSPTEEPTEPTVPSGDSMQQIDLTGCVVGVCSSPFDASLSYANQIWYSSKNPSWRDLSFLVDGNYDNEVHWGVDPGERADVYLDLSNGPDGYTAVDKIKLYHSKYAAVSTAKVILVLADGTLYEQTLTLNWVADSAADPAEYTFDQTYNVKGVYIWQNNNSTASYGEIELFQRTGGSTTDPTTAPTQPTTAPTQPTTAPTQPTQPAGTPTVPATGTWLDQIPASSITPHVGDYLNGNLDDLNPGVSGEEAYLNDAHVGTAGWIGSSGQASNKIQAVLFELNGTKTVGGVEMTARDGDYITEFDIEVKDTNGVWQTVKSVTSNPFTDGYTVMYTFDPVVGTDVRILVYDYEGGSADYPMLMEIALFEVKTGTILQQVPVTSVTANKSPSSSKYTVNKIFDGDKKEGIFEVLASSLPVQIVANLTDADGNPSNIARMKLFAYDDDRYTAKSITVEVQTTQDGAWTQVYSGNAYTLGFIDTFVLDFDQAYDAYALRLTVSSTISGYLIIPEVELYGYEYVEAAPDTILVGASYSIHLIEPWALRTNIMFAKNTPDNLIPVSTFTEYGAYAIIGDKFDGTTAEELMADPDAVKYTSALGNISVANETTLTFDFYDGLYSYNLDQTVYWVVYYADANGTYTSSVQEKTLMEVADSLLDKSTVSAEEKAVLNSMKDLKDAVVALRGESAELGKVYPAGVANTNALGNRNDGYACGTSHQIRLIEPWGIRVRALFYNTEAAAYADYENADDYGLIFFHDKDNKYGGTMTTAQMSAETEAKVYSKLHGNATIGGSGIVAVYDHEIYTYQLDSELYCLPYIVVDGQYYYPPNVICYNLLDEMVAFSNDTDLAAEEIAVFEAMINYYNSVIMQRSAAGASHNWVERSLAEAVADFQEKHAWTSLVSAYGQYENHTEFLCKQCSSCLTIDVESIRYMYSQQEIAEKMLALINAEREKLGYESLELTVDNRLMQFADVRAEEISTKFDHSGSDVGGAAENIAVGTSSSAYNDAIQFFFDSFYASTNGYKENMLAEDAKYFGCDIYWDGSSLYCVQLFWTEADESSYDELTFTPVTRFLVASDSHITSDGDAQCQRITKMFNEAYALSNAHQYYKNLDAAVFCGDLTNTGTQAQYDAFAATTEDALRGDTKLYAVAAKSHDCSTMGASAISYFSNLLGQPSDFHVVINGFHFIGISASNTDAHYTSAQVTWLDAQLLEATQDAPQQPVFVFQHEHISDTVFGSYEQDGWGMDTFSAVLEKYPQAIDFSGHSHYPANDPRSIWQGTYTAIGDGGLYYAEFTVDDENCIHPDKYDTVAQALIVEIDAENRVLVKVLDVTANRILCTYLIDNVTSPNKDKYSHETRENAAVAPTFADNAQLTVQKSGTTTKITVPQASVVANSGNEVYLYRLTVTDAYGNVVLTDWEFSEYYIADRPDSITFSVQLPSNAKYISVAAEDVWGHLSEPLTAGI